MADKIFINYRRDDAIAAAGRLHDRLSQAFGRRNLFMDVDHIPAGVDFVSYLERQVAACEVFLVVIGPRWLDARDEAGQRRLDNTEDFVVIEIAAALARDTRVIPVLIDGASMPKASDLPDGLKSLARRNAVEVRNTQFGRDAEVLVQKIREALKADGAGKQTSMPLTRIAAGSVAAFAIAYAAAYTAGAPVPWFARSLPDQTPISDGTVKLKQQDAAAKKAGQIERERLVAALAAQEDAKSAELKAKEDARRAEAKKAEEAARRDPALSVKPGSGVSFRDCAGCPEMVVVPAGSFMMGSTANEIEALVQRELSRTDASASWTRDFAIKRYRSEGPQHLVTIARPLAVGKFEVTFDEWDACVAAGGCKYSPSPAFASEAWGRGRRPVLDVSWDDITTEYLPWLSRKTGKVYRLLTEAEWEYACRAGTTTRYAFGDAVTRGLANYLPDNGGWKTLEVGSFPANQFGLHDMHGNVAEWVQDCESTNYEGAPSDGSARVTGLCAYRIVRGGSIWADPPRLRAATRLPVKPDNRGLSVGARINFYGFRVARSL